MSTHDMVRIGEALERIADALELLATAYVQDRQLDVGALVQTQSELVNFEWLKSTEQ